MIEPQPGVSVPGVLITVALSFLVAEFAGYWLHRLLHSDKIAFLSRGHLIHHFLVYGPQHPLRSQDYKTATAGRFNVGNIGLEWLGPSAILLGFCWAMMILMRVPRDYQFISLGALLLWPILMFNYLHDRMHLANFWMSRVPLVKIWYLNARRLHDIHHLSMSDAGRMDANFGIGFFWFDRCFGTIAARHHPFNRKGFETAKKRYGLTGTEGDQGNSLLTGPAKQAN
jgi:sterol desaturase/sphingolipid hydroxylase (fatty acid hydroxylase superfamily)